MSRLRFVLPCLCAFAAVLLSCAAADAADWDLKDWFEGASPWKGHGVGSHIVTTTTTERPKIPGMPDNLPNVPGLGGGKTTEKKTLTAITEKEYVFKVEATVGGQKTVREEREPKVRSVKAKTTDAGEGEVTVGGQGYACKKKLISSYAELLSGQMPSEGKGAQMPDGPALVWEHDKLGVLKMQIEMDMMGHKSTVVWQVAKLDVSHKVGDQAFSCREITLSNSMMPQGKMTMLVSRTFPDGTLRYQNEMAMMGHKTKTTREVTQYVKKPVAATTPAK